ncbi:MAG TPA: hypothetical protein VJI98_00360 [Candidatus Nanoarchaeia archaeon]|nr:hypothetical protein [Candidatus Nanoarchaeia archaeon]
MADGKDKDPKYAGLSLDPKKDIFPDRINIIPLLENDVRHPKNLKQYLINLKNSNEPTIIEDRFHERLPLVPFPKEHDLSRIYRTPRADGLSNWRELSFAASTLPLNETLADTFRRYTIEGDFTPDIKCADTIEYSTRRAELEKDGFAYEGSYGTIKGFKDSSEITAAIDRLGRGNTKTMTSFREGRREVFTLDLFVKKAEGPVPETTGHE